MKLVNTYVTCLNCNIRLFKRDIVDSNLRLTGSKKIKFVKYSNIFRCPKCFNLQEEKIEK